MRSRLLLLFGLCLLLATLAFAGDVQIWPKIEGVPNFGVGLPDSQNGQHPLSRESYGEGWFWMGTYDDGSFSFVNFMVSNIGPGDNKGTVDVTVTEADGKTHLARVAFSKGSFQAAKEKLDVRVGENRVWGSHPTYHLKLAEKDVALDLTYTAELPGFALNSGRVTYGNPKDFYSVYATIPRAKITGTIKTPSGTRQVTGYGYSDHGVVTMLPHEYSDHWLTLRCFDEKYTVDMLEYTTPSKWGGKRVAMGIAGVDGKIIYGGSGYTLQTSAGKTDPTNKIAYPTQYAFTMKGSKATIKGTYKVKKLLHSIDLLAQLNFIERKVASFFAKSYVLRMLVELEAEVTFPDGTTDRFTAPGLAEVVTLH
jgi:Svf1-like C-terminal lipocalin-like domain/CrtC N-terminal lipocalin domain